jgi:hypothetical protein
MRDALRRVFEVALGCGWLSVCQAAYARASKTGALDVNRTPEDLSGQVFQVPVG